ncbi:MAG: hypothetical protein U5K37_09960 [Natrialbaceae archaeon]|nr:hypothetical protein [Natrialbaceae archaeon]
MIDFTADFLSNIDEIATSLTILFPGFLAYFTYVGLRTTEFEEIKRSHVLLILFFILFFQILRDLSGFLMDFALYQGVFFFFFPVVVGALADLGHRLFVTVLARSYQNNIVESVGVFGRVDVGNVSRWQKTVKKYVEEGLNNITKEYYLEVDVADESGTAVIQGFLNGYSENDIELIRYDDLLAKDFSGIGTPDIEEEVLTMTVEIVPRERVRSLRIYRVKLEDFELE